MSAVPVIVGLVALQRLVEIRYANRNTRALLENGGTEIGRRHYPLFIFLHAAWLAAILWFVPWNMPVSWPWLAALIILQGLRLWVIASLGPYWTTRIIIPASAILVTRGPYRWLRHPNYLVVIAEIAVLPLVFGAWQIALIFSVLNLALLAWRIRIEEQALAPRRSLSGGYLPQ